MLTKLMAILNGHGILSLATLRKDGWPQSTTVSFVNDGLVIYFLVSRKGQKFDNIRRDERVSASIASEPRDSKSIIGLSLAGRANEARDEPYRTQALRKLRDRHPGYFYVDSIDESESALIRLLPSVISIVDYSKGLGHQDLVTVGAEQIVEMTAVSPNRWGPGPAPDPNKDPLAFRAQG